jgi:ABC-type transporter Mla subunit MlaD
MGSYWSRMGTYYIHARFADAGTVEPGADVTMSGVRIGTVAKVELRPDEASWPGRPALVTLAIKRGVEIPGAYEVAIAQGGLLASRYISVDPPKRQGPRGPHPATAPGTAIQPNQVVPGVGFRGLAALDSMADSVSEAAPQLTSALEQRINRLADRAEATYLGADQERLVKQILTNLSSMTAIANRATLQAERLARTLNATAQAGRPEVVAILKELKGTAANVRASAERVHQFIVTTPLPGDLTATGQNARRASAAAADAAVAVRDLVASPDTQAKLREMTDDLAKSSAALAHLTEQADKTLGDQQMQSDLKASVAGLRQTMDSLQQTTAHLQKVLMDPAMTEDLRATVHNMREATAQGADVGRKASASLDRVDRTMDRLSAAVTSVRPQRTEGLLDVSGIRHRGLQADVDVNLHYGREGEGYWRLGMVDLGDTERMDFQRAIRLSPPWTLRAGVFANKPGIGVDWVSSQGWRAELEYWDPENPLLDLSLYRSFSHDWLLGLGLRDTLGDREPFLTVRRQFNVSGSPGGAP